MVNLFKRKKFLSLLGFLPSEIRFFNGNGNGDGNGDAGIGGPGGVGSQTGGAVGTGGVLGGETPSGEVPTGGSPDLSLDEAIGILGGAYPSAQPSTPSAPSNLSDLENAFSPPSFEFTPEGEPIAGTTVGFGRPGAMPSGGLTQVGVNFVGALIDILSGLLGLFTGQPAVGIGVSSAQTLSQRTTGKTLGQKFAAEAKAVTFAAVNVQAQAPSAKVESAPVSPSTKGTPITISPYSGQISEGLNEGLFSIPITQKEPSSYYAKTTSVPLSTSLFGAGKESGGGLMIFPTSTKGIEAEGSSLLKKQEPVIDTTSLLFLLGMGVVGIVLRKGARA